MIVLGFDTSTKAASVSLVKDGSVLGEVLINDKRTHSQKIMPILESLMNLSDLTIDDIDLLAVNIGPGSFTGLRIAMATVKAISHVKDIDIVAVDSLESLAYNAIASSKLIVPVIDAQKDQVYTGFYKKVEKDIDGLGRIVVVENVSEIGVKEVCDLISEIDLRNEETLVVGEGIEKCGDRLNKDLIEVSSNSNNVSKSTSVCMIAMYKYYLKKDIYSCYDIKPLYIRKSQAEIQYEEKQKAKEKKD